MYTQDDVRMLFSQRSEIEMELKTCLAQYHKRTDEIPLDMQQRINQLERDLMTIDSFFSVLSTNEEFVVRRHIMEGLDWPQVLGKFVEEWGTAAERSVRSLQIYQTKALKKVARVLNNNVGFSCIKVRKGVSAF